MRAPLFLALLVASSAATADALATVEFIAPEKFRDVRDAMIASKPERNPHLKDLKRYVEKRALRYLKADQWLEIRFTDIDLAGEHLPQHNPNLIDVRTVTSIYPPRMKFDYTLKDGAGAVIKSGSADIRDIGFDSNHTGLRSDALRFEKRLIDDWMKQELR